MKQVFLVLTVFCFCGSAQEPDEFPQWNRKGWVVSAAPDTIELPCTSDRYYPFTNLVEANAQSIQWILPESTSYIHLLANESHEGWHVDQDNKLFIEKKELNVPESVVGQYVCAALAPVNAQSDPEVVAWYYLKWGVGLYGDVPAMMDPIDYSHNFLVAGISLLVFFTVALIVLFTAACRISEEPVDDIDAKDDDEFTLDYSDEKDEKQSNFPAV